MATQADLEFTYSLIDRIFRLSLGEMADFSGAKFDGDFSLTLEEAQRRKHEYVASSIGIDAGRRVLDLGCGWGPLLNYMRTRGANGLGVTLSSAQAAACRRNGLDARLHDMRAVDAGTFGGFDAVASLGAFEHVCSVDDYDAGRQEDVYRDFFANVATVLPPGGRFYLQTMVFGPNMIDPDAVSHRRATRVGRVDPRPAAAPVPWILPALRRGAGGPHRGTALHAGVESSSGRLDYIETIKRWRALFGQPSLRKTLMKVRLVPKYLTSPDFRLAFTSGVSANSICFERELLEHHRIVFQRA